MHKALLMLVFALLISSLSIHRSLSGYPRQGVTSDVSFSGSESLYIQDLIFLYTGDKLSFSAKVISENYSVSIKIKGILTGKEYVWNNNLSSVNPILPVFISEADDWYVIVASFTSNTGLIEDIEYSLSVYEVPRENLALRSSESYPILFIILLIFILVFEALSSRFKIFKYLAWEISSSYKWLIAFFSFILFITLFSMFTSEAPIIYQEISMYPLHIDDEFINGLYLVEGIYNSAPLRRIVQTILVLSILVNLVNVSYPLDRRYYRIELSIGKDILNMYVSKWIVGFILIAIPYVTAKVYLDLLIFEELERMLKAYGYGLQTRLFIDIFTIFFFYTAIFSIAFLIRNISIAIPVLISPIIVYSTFSDVHLVDLIFNFPLKLREYFMLGCFNIFECISIYEIVIFFLPLILLLISIPAIRRMDWS